MTRSRSTLCWSRCSRGLPRGRRRCSGSAATAPTEPGGRSGACCRPAGIYYRLTDGWLRVAHALAADLGAKLILGINLAAGRPAIAAAEGRALLAGIGRQYIQAFEIGNEPDLYGAFPWYRDRHGHLHWARGRHYGLSDYITEFGRWSKALPNVPLAGPAASGPAWMGKLGKLLAAEHSLQDSSPTTAIRSAACITNPDRTPATPRSPTCWPTARRPVSRMGWRRTCPSRTAATCGFRLTEINSASCEGAKGVSDTFASALWALDTMFDMASVGVDGVNVHMLPGSNYELFTPSADARAGPGRRSCTPSTTGC